MPEWVGARMSRAHKVSWFCIIGGMGSALVLMLVAPGGSRHLPWLAMMVVVNGGLLTWNARSNFRTFDAGEEVVFSVSMGVFLTMLLWAWVIGP